VLADADLQVTQMMTTVLKIERHLIDDDVCMTSVVQVNRATVNRFQSVPTMLHLSLESTAVRPDGQQDVTGTRPSASICVGTRTARRSLRAADRRQLGGWRQPENYELMGNAASVMIQQPAAAAAASRCVH
jgi:hypothetical protein